MVAILLTSVLSYAMISAYSRRRYDIFLLLLITMMSRYFYLLPIEITKSCEHIQNLALTALFLHNLIKGRISIGGTIGRIILLLLAYFHIRMIFSVLLGEETFIQAFKVVLTNYYMLAYFLFLKIDEDSLNRICKPLFVMTIVGGIAYYLQFVGINLLQGRVDSSISMNSFRYMNVPQLLQPCLIYLLFCKNKIKYRHLYLLFLIPMILLPQSRGTIMAFSSACVLYVLYLKNPKAVIKLLVVAFVGFFAFEPLLQARFSDGKGNQSIFEAIGSGFDIRRSDDFDASQSDTYAFRIAMAMERVEYLSDDPIKLLFGVGTMHEETGQKQFNFHLGSRVKNKEGRVTKGQIETSDIEFMTYTFRYGIVYLIIMLAFLIQVYRIFHRHLQNNKWAIVGYVFFVRCAIQCTGTNPFSEWKLENCFILFLLAAILFSKERDTAQSCMVKKNEF